MQSRTQVIIVGGGPVGLALAVDLSQRGVSTVVLERHGSLSRIPKGQNLMQRSLEHCYFWGCVDELRAARIAPPGYPIGGVTAYGNLMGEYWYLPEDLSAVGQYFFQEHERLPQYRTEEVLRARLAELDEAAFRPGVTATAIEELDGTVRVTAARTERPEEREVLEADYVVGCDGAHSFVREQLDIERRGRNFDQKLVLAVFASKELHEALERFPPRTTYRVLNPDYAGMWLFFGRVRIGETWFFHGPVPRDTTADDLDAVRALMYEAAGLEFACEFEHIGFWELRIDVATTYRKGRVLIAGDACHAHPPYGGLGLNSGFDDAANLAWKLAAVINGWGGEALLDSYSEERQPIFEQTGEDLIAGWIDSERDFLTRYRPEADRAGFEARWREHTGGETAPSWYEPFYEGSSVVVGAPSEAISIHGEHRFTARPGHHLSPQPLSSGRNVFEELGADLTLLAFGADDGDIAALSAAASALGIPLTVVRDTFEDGRRKYEARLVLVRPDQYVAWVGDAAPSDPVALLATVVGRD